MSIPGLDKDAPGATLFEMMECLGMEPAGAPVPRFGHMLASAFHTCKRCHSVTECKEWLTAASGRNPSEAPRYCLNGELLSEFLAEPLMKKEP
jgi:hypothetical protein